MNWRALPSLSALRAFAAYAQTGNLQKAGDALNVSHAAISQQIRSLETRLGLTLLDRSARQSQLTAEGRALAEAVNEGFNVIAKRVEMLTGAENARALVVSTTPSFAAQWLVPRLADFRARHPEIDIVFKASTDLIDMARGDADIAIRFGKGQWEGLEVYPLLPTRMVAVASPDLLPRGTTVELEALRSLPVLQEVGTSENTLWLARHGLEDAGKGGRVALPGNLTLDAARAGQGIAVAARVWVDADLAAGRLVKLFEDPEDFGYFALVRPGVHRPALGLFLRWLKAQACAAP